MKDSKVDILIRSIPQSISTRLQELAKENGYSSMNPLIIDILTQYVNSDLIVKKKISTEVDEQLLSEVLERNTHVLNLIKEDYLDGQT